MKRRIILAGLRARPVRTAVSALAIAIEVTLILVIAGLATGMVQDNARRMAGIGADILIQPPGATRILIFNGVMPQKMGGRLTETQDVRAAAPVLILTNSEEGFEQVWGIEPASFDVVSGGLHYLQGAQFSAPGEVVVDKRYATSKNVAIGDHVRILTRDMKIAGIVESGKGARIFISLGDAQDMSGQEGKVSLFFLKLVSPGAFDGVTARLKRSLDGYVIVDYRDFLSRITPDTMPGLREFLQVVEALAVCIGVLVIFLSMYTAITERTREIGVLRSLGASKAAIVDVILRESAVLSAVGVIVGMALSIGVASAIQWKFPTLDVEFTPAWIATAIILAVLSGVIGAIYPSYKAARLDPIEALAYE
ncbi:MAG TPA: FtsX-like permease family protein [Terriglobia bacterium]|nr:FtsX-like permease family protein [Terriglobia bacterium]